MAMARRRTEQDMEQARSAGEVVVSNEAAAQKPTEAIQISGALRLFFSTSEDLMAWLANIERLEAERVADIEAQAQALSGDKSETGGDIPN